MRKALVLPTPRPHFTDHRYRGNDSMCKSNFIQLTAEILRKVLAYDKDSGVFTWIVSRNTNAKAGDIAGCGDGRGYIRIRIFNKKYRAHRLAWLYFYGAWPSCEVDHINGNKADNRISNLRLATRMENNQNTGIRVDNTSGYRGVSWHKKSGKWVAYINHNGKRFNLGVYETAQDASVASNDARKKMHTHHRLMA